jgi:MFS family permease
MLGMVFSGFGIGMMIPNTNLLVMQITPAEIRGKEIGKLTMFWFMGQFLSPVITLPLLRYFDLPNIFMVAALMLFALSIVFLVLHFTKRGDRDISN